MERFQHFLPTNIPVAFRPCVLYSEYVLAKYIDFYMDKVFVFKV